MVETNGVSQIVLFESSDGEVNLEVAIDVGEDEIWLNRSQMALLFDRDVKTIGKHIANALKEELDGSQKPVVANLRQLLLTENHTRSNTTTSMSSSR